ncbi:hypothetical protein [Pedobacter aquatilis]|uniref:hypothetical protein n=1 Tax=Pedobacter aquatilis TaxID=351343 RepID=UPI00292F87F3|nr:hypothetical protein [Pedobacter aquatilis]
MVQITYVRDGNGKYYRSNKDVGQAFGKVVLVPSTKKFSFFYNGKLQHSSNYLVSVDGQRGEESYGLQNGYSAHRFIVERDFVVLYQPSNGVLYEYHIFNYKISE